MVVVTAALLGGCSKNETGSDQAFCDDLRRVPSLASVLTGFSEMSPAKLTEALDDAEASFAQLRRSAPEDLSDEVDRVVELVMAVIDGVRANATDPVAAAETIRKAVAAHPRAEEAGLAVAEAARTRCSVELNPTVVENPDPTASSSTASSSTGSSTTGPDQNGPSTTG